MKTAKCTKCKKIIEGYTNRQVNYMLEQHMLTHKIKKK